MRFLSDEQLLGQSRLEAYRGSGPGGQKRNKTSNSLRITHLPTATTVVAGESRSASENKMRALRRLRLRLAIQFREPINKTRFDPPDWFREVSRNRRIECSYRHKWYSATAGLLLDLLKEMQGNVADVGVMLAVSTTAIVRFLESDPQIWTEANRIRASASQPPLRSRK